MKEGDVFESVLDGLEYEVKRIVNEMVVLQSRSANKQILTGVQTLETTSLYRKKEEVNK